MTNFLSGVAVVLSLLSLLLGGFATYQVLGLQNRVSDLASAPASPTADSDQTSTASTLSSTESSSPNTDAAGTATATGNEIQPKQFVSPAFETIGEVELLSVKRIQDPETGNRDAVNVQFRLRRLSPDFPDALSQILNPGEATARNPETSETYQPVDSLERATDPIAINLIDVNSSVDGYVWLRIPEGVNTIDLFFPETQGFKNVPIN